MGVLICGIDWKSKERQYTREVEQPQSLVEAALDVVHQISVPKCHDDLQGGSVLEYETSLGYWPKEPA